MSMTLFIAISEIFKNLLHEDVSTFNLKYTTLIKLCNIPLYYSNNSRCRTSQKSSPSTNNPLSHQILITDTLSITMLLFTAMLLLLWGKYFYLIINPKQFCRRKINKLVLYSNILVNVETTETFIRGMAHPNIKKYFCVHQKIERYTS